ncbi:MAG TPA: allophanate hydrolase [Steroidobacteraceae bacterium]|nr:allophanate hydrolase [Steroidobacteraceae bacterium]
MHSRSLAQIAGAVSSGASSAESTATRALAEAAAYDAVQPQAWISRCAHADVLASARRVDQRIAAGERLPLAGVPFAVKDNIDVAGMETTAACPAFAYTAGASATVVERLIAAGAVLIGKTNLDQFATGLAGTRSPYGMPRCVFNREYVSGGSSSGSAVVVAAGIVPLALGSDTAGSGRVPAAFNGLVGFKPTRGRWSTRGLVPACRTLDCVTSLTMTAADAALVDSVIGGFDPADPYSRPARAASEIGVPFRFGVPLPAQRQFLGDAEAAALYHAALERLNAAGGSAVGVDITPLLDAARLLYSGPWVAERATVVEELLARNASAIHPVVRAIVQAGQGISAVEAFRSFYTLQGYARAAEALWDVIDVLALPTTPTIYRVSELLAEPVALNSQLGLYTNFVNLLDMSALALPAGFRQNATGFGVSLIAPASADRGLLELARRLETMHPLPEAPALDTAPRTHTVKLAVVGAHLSDMPLHWQLASRGARLAQRTRTAPVYRLYAMRGHAPPKPALVHVGAGGGSIELEVYELDVAAFGSFVAEVPAPLAIGTVVLRDGSDVHGFVAEPRAIEGAEDITSEGGWRAYLRRTRASTAR